MKDFTRERKKIEFKIDDDVFTAKSPIPAQTLMDFASAFSSMNEDSAVEDQLAAFQGVLDLVLMPQSLERFKQRMSDADEPVSVEQVEEIVSWLFEEYGLRPTQPSEPSVPGPPAPDSGMSLTGNTPVVVSTSSDSPAISS
jgi:hypothetical protein